MSKLRLYLELLNICAVAALIYLVIEYALGIGIQAKFPFLYSITLANLFTNLYLLIFHNETARELLNKWKNK